MITKLITALIMKLPVVRRLEAKIAVLRQQVEDERKALENRDATMARLSAQWENAYAHHLNEAREAKKEAVASKAEARQLRDLRNVAWPKPATRITPADVSAALDVEMTNPLWQAVHQELDDAIGDALDEVTQDPGASLTAERRLHVAGGAEYLRRFQKHLLDLQQAASVKDAEMVETE